MKIFNKGARSFLFHGLRLEPMTFTEIPEKYEASAAKLLADYPTELVTGENAGAASQVLAKEKADLEREVAELKRQNEKLQKLLVSSPEETAAAGAVQQDGKIAALETDLATARSKIAALEAALAAKPKRAPKEPI